jgi:hypothetical protein
MSGVFDHSPQFPFTAAVTDLLTPTAAGGGAVPAVNSPIQFYAKGGLPAPLVVDTTYFVRDVLASTFKVAATPGGVAIDITTTGTAPNSYAAPSALGPVALEIFPDSITKAGRQTDWSPGTYKAPPPAAKLEEGFVYDSVTGTLTGGGGEWWG